MQTLSYDMNGSTTCTWGYKRNVHGDITGLPLFMLTVELLWLIFLLKFAVQLE